MESEFDVVVLWWWVAWVSAAISASREWKSVVIIERNSLLWGLATCWLIHRYEPLCDGRWKQIIYSQAEELLKLSIKYWYKTLDENWLTKGEGRRRYATMFNPNLFALSLVRLLDQEWVKIFFESQISEIHSKNSRITSVDIYTIEWKINIKGKVFIDATGSGYVWKMAWIPYKNGKNYLTYTTTSYRRWLNKPIFERTWAWLNWEDQPKWVRIFNKASQEDVNDYLLIGQKLVLEEYEKWIKKDLSILPNMIQFRKISMLKWEHILSSKDLKKHFNDSVGVIWVFNRPWQRYEIPIRCLYNKKFSNLFFAWRNISSYDDAREATRVIPVCILTWEVAWIMSSLFIDEKKVNLSLLQEKELKRGIKIHY